jgi:hypothetical protein
MRHWPGVLAVIFFSFSTAPLLADPVQLPAGWAASAPDYGMSTVTVPNSDDMVIVGVLASNDPDKIVSTMAAQTTPAYTIEQAWPITKTADGMVQGGATLRLSDGRTAGNFIFAAPLADGTTALTSVITANVQDKDQLVARMRELGEIMKQLRSGATLP